MGEIVTLSEQSTGRILYPRTYTKAVVDENGNPIDNILQDFGTRVPTPFPNLEAIKASGDTSIDKIFIAQDTKLQYIYYEGDYHKVSITPETITILDGIPAQEELRKQNEISRKESEELRNTAEQKRQTDTTEVINKANTATTQVTNSIKEIEKEIGDLTLILDNINGGV